MISINMLDVYACASIRFEPVVIPELLGGGAKAAALIEALRGGVAALGYHPDPADALLGEPAQGSLHQLPAQAVALRGRGNGQQVDLTERRSGAGASNITGDLAPKFDQQSH